MSSITIRNLDDQLKASLRLRAARHGLSMEQEVRNILQNALATESDAADGLNFALRINQRFKGLGADDLPLPERQTARMPLVTRNTKDFIQIDGLTLIDPWQAH